jgi:hypothetical protein
MNADEAIAEKYLKTLGVVKYEPDGNVPPDFLLDGKYAVEVRRLNQNHRTPSSVKGLEEAEIPFVAAIQKELALYPAGEGKKYWMSIRYQRPFGNISDIKKSLKAAFESFEENAERIPATFRLSQNVEIVISAEAGTTNKKYSLGIFNDYDSGGWVIDMYSTEINHCATEKAAKVKPYFHKYSQWWLLLVDHLGYMDTESLGKTLELIHKHHEFDSILVVNAQSGLRFEI